MAKCEQCGKLYVAKRKDQKFCSRKCRKQNYDETIYHVQITEKTCANPECKRTFTTRNAAKQDYCCSACRARARVLRTQGICEACGRTAYLYEKNSHKLCETCRNMVDAMDTGLIDKLRAVGV